jgi:hypothetical protein
MVRATLVRTLVVAVALLVLPGTLLAQKPEPVDVDRLPIDVQRIVVALQQSAVREERDGLNLRYYVSIFGELPRIEIFTKEDNLTTGPVPYTAPTHQEFLDHVTPKEFRTPPMDIGAALRWLSERFSGRSNDRTR